jgi:heterotetrameric sarcosine oxidase gamma subunit
VADLTTRGLTARDPAARGLIARSPVRPAEPAELAGWEVTGRVCAADLTLTDVTPLAKVLVRAPFDGETARVLAVPFGRAARDGQGDLVTGSGPGEWLVLGPAGGQAALARRLAELTAPGAASELVTVLDFTHARALLRLTGTAAVALLAKVCAIDLADAVTPDGTAFRSSVAKVVTDVVRDDRARPSSTVPSSTAPSSTVPSSTVPSSTAPSYLLGCERSYGQYLFDALLDAGGEFGIDTDGFRL